MRARAAAAPLLLLALCLTVLASGCGSSDSPTGQSERAHDVEVVNVAIGQEMDLVDAYRRVEAGVPDPRAKAILRRYVAQEQEHIDAWTKAMRGLGGQVEAEPEALDYSGLHEEGDYLLFAYELTSSELTHFLDDVTHLSTRAPQSFAASIAANEAQHLVVLRQLLGAGLLEAVPDSFDTGEVPPPAKSQGATPPGKE